MCSRATPVTEYLFGDNLDADLKAVVNTNRLVKPPVMPSRRFHPYRSKGHWKGQGSSKGPLNWGRDSFKNKSGSYNQRTQEKEEDAKRSKNYRTKYRQ
ncbi:unnamed protein product [Allacma fusca]|uniref:Uncharacterized protein n=1 Tax=Allacma fusca TaxID=39272 RepID=A0A8J2LIA1_9HEXA|nr:unnamed protein product [Allacma fusca]